MALLLAPAPVVRSVAWESDPVAALLGLLGDDMVSVSTLGNLWDMAEDDALEVAADAEDLGLVQVIDADDAEGPSIVLTADGRTRAGLEPLPSEETPPPGMRRMRYRDGAGKVRYAIVPAELHRALDNHDRTTRRADAQWRELVLTGTSGEDSASPLDWQADPSTPDPLADLVADEKAAALPHRRGSPKVAAPRIRHVVGLRPVWQGPAWLGARETSCPGCGDLPLPLTTCCVVCDAMGNAAMLEAVAPSELPKVAEASKPRPKRPRPAKRKPDAPALDAPKPKTKRQGYRHPSPAGRKHSFDLASLRAQSSEKSLSAR